MLYQDGSELPEPVFRFHNIGPIAQADLSLGGLTVLAGRNNTGKTYLVYTLYGFLKDFKQAAIYHLERSSEIRGFPSPVANFIRELRNSGQASYVIDEEEFNGLRKATLAYITDSYSEIGLADVFSSQWGVFEDASIEVDFSNRRLPSCKQEEFSLTGRGTLSMQYDGREVSAALEGAPSRRPVREIQNNVAQFFVDLLLEDLPSDPFILSAERFGISLFYRELDFTKSNIVDLLQRMGSKEDRDRDFAYYSFIDWTTSRYAQPVKDNIDYTRSIQDLKMQKSQFYKDKLFDDIRDMMGGYYGSSGGDLRFISKSRGKRRFNLPLHLASSSARELSDLYFYLRHVARKNQLLIIDEPESHLDTANQRLMARLLARFVRAGIRVLITTHSDYIIKEFNNLIMLSSQFKGRDGVAKRLGYSDGDYLPKRSVRAYVAEDDSLSWCTVDQFGMNMPVFDDTIDKINRVANELSARVEEIG